VSQHSCEFDGHTNGGFGLEPSGAPASVKIGGRWFCATPPLSTAASVHATVYGHPGVLMDLLCPEKENLGLKKTSASQYY
jgi:hypothetical protein